MRAFEKPLLHLAAPALLISAACSIGCQGTATGGDGETPPVLVGSGGSGSTGGSGGGVVPLPDGTKKESLLPARIRRLTVAEYEASLRDLVGDVADGAASEYVPDSRQGPYTVNEAQRVDPVLAKQLAATAESLAQNVASRVTELAPCSDSASQGEACAKEFINTFAGRAYRRPIDSDEVDQLLTVYRVGVDGGTYAEGIGLIARAVFQSASMLYLTEIAGGAKGEAILMNPYEIASSISYLLNQKPPSAELIAAAVAGELNTPEGRAEAVDQLMQGPDALRRFTRIVSEWVGTDRMEDTAKDSNVYQSFTKFKPALEAETASFLNYLVTQPGRGTVGELLGATDTYGDQLLAEYYGSSVQNPDASGKGVIQVPDRVGILNRGAFLSVFAHASEKGPVLRGVAVMRRVLCSDPGSPTELNINIVPPAPDPNKTTRERFAVHSTDPLCAGCHKRIDAYGFSFEQFDGMGQFMDRESNKDVDSTTTIDFGTEFDGTYQNSNELAAAIATSSQARECFARQVFRASAGTSDPALSATEQGFVDYWKSNAALAESGDIVGTVKAYVTSPSFVLRRAQ